MNYSPNDIITVSRPAYETERVRVTRVFDPSEDNSGYILAGITESNVGHLVRQYPSGVPKQEITSCEVFIKAEWIHGNPKWVLAYERDHAPLYGIVVNASREVLNGRELQDILTHATTELGELAQEIQIHEGKSYKEPGPDGVVGEAVDVILCMMDLIFQVNPNLTPRDINRIAQDKCQKWVQYAKSKEEYA